MKDMWGLNLYILVSTIITILILKYFKKHVISIERKNKILKFFAIITVVLHYSSIPVDYFSSGSASVDGTMLLPIFPCNVAMWTLVLVAFFKNKSGKVFDFFTQLTFYVGVGGGMLGIAFNEAYINNPSLSDWSVLKGLLSHSTMLIGSLYLFVGEYFEIRVTNMKNIILSLLFLLVDGIVVILIHVLFKLDPPNSMYLLEAPYDSLPWLNTWSFGSLAIIIAFIITATYEWVKLEKKDRWYTLLKKDLTNKNKK